MNEAEWSDCLNPTEMLWSLINPIVAVLCGWIIFNETLTAFIAIGGLVAISGVYLVNKSYKELPAIEQPETEGI